MNDEDRFTNLFIDSLLNKLELDPNDIIIVIFSIRKKLNINIEKISDVKYFEYSEEILNNFSKIKSLTFMSLNNWNAPIIKDIINNGISVDKIYIYITDDEISRWKLVYEKFGKLIENKKKHLSKDVLYIIKLLKNFIVPKDYFYDILITILERRTFSIVNASVIFDILPYHYSSKLHSFLENKDIIKNEFKRVMIGTKKNSFGVIDTVNIIKSFCQLQLHCQYEFICYNSLGSRILIDIYLLFLQKVKRQKVIITYCSNMNSLLYNTLLLSSTYLILQPRGGGSSARLFAKWMCGYLVIKNKSPNALFFEKVYKTDFIKFDKIVDISNNLIYINDIDVIKNRESVLKEELRSIKELKTIYN